MSKFDRYATPGLEHFAVESLLVQLVVFRLAVLSPEASIDRLLRRVQCKLDGERKPEDSPTLSGTRPPKSRCMSGLHGMRARTTKFVGTSTRPRVGILWLPRWRRCATQPPS
jgi:hypothetical protein